jgi:hypothetical protein
MLDTPNTNEVLSVPPPPGIWVWDSEADGTTSLQVEEDAPPKKFSLDELADLAQDLCFFSDHSVADVLQPYGITHNQLIAMRAHSAAFKAAESNARKMLKEDKHIGVRVKAKGFAMHRLDTLNLMAGDMMVEPKDRLKAIEMLFKVADLNPKEVKEEGRASASVVLNFGNSIGQTLAESMTVEMGT